MLISDPSDKNDPSLNIDADTNSRGKTLYFKVDYFHILQPASNFLSVLDLGISAVGYMDSCLMTVNTKYVFDKDHIEQLRIKVKNVLEEAGFTKVSVTLYEGDSI